VSKRRTKTKVTRKTLNLNPFSAIKREFTVRGIPHAEQFIKDEGDILAAEVQLYVWDQTGAGSWPPLSHAWLQTKIREGLDERMLVAAGDYYAAIKARKKAGGSKVEVGLPDDAHPSSGLPYKELGRILEYGHRGFKQVGEGLIPPRPHWRPVWFRWRKKLPKVAERMSKEVGKAVFDRVKRKLVTKKTEVKS
jgi:hypothetical protein